MKPGDDVRFGLIGAGVAAATHAREMAQVSGGAIVAVQARNAEKAAAFAARHGIPQACADLRRMVSEAALQAVIVATPNGLHLEAAVAAAEAGLHVVVEKPLEISEERARRILAACRASGVGLDVIYQRRSSRAAAQARADLAARAYGEIVLVNILDHQFRDPAYYARDAWRGTRAVEGGGCVVTQATHMLDLAQHLVGPVRAVTAKTATRLHAIETEDTAAAMLEFENGALGAFSASTAAAPGLRHLLTISGTQGSIVLNGEHDQILFRQVAGEAASGLPPEFGFADPVDPRLYPTLGQRRQLQEIVDRMRGGASAPPDEEEALRPVRLVDAIYASAAAGGARREL